MAEWQSTMSVNTHRKGAVRYPLISDAFVFPTAGRDCLYRSIRSRCIPLIGARHCRRTYDACQRRWGCLWIYYVILGWTTLEILLDWSGNGGPRWWWDVTYLDTIG